MKMATMVMKEVDGEEEVLAPMPPPPRPQAPPSIRGIPSLYGSIPRPPPAVREQQRRLQRPPNTRDDEDDDDHMAPQPAPVPHLHPFMKLETERASSPNDGDYRQKNRKPILMGKRLNPSFFNRDRIIAFAHAADIVDVQENASPNSLPAPLERIQMHSSRVLEQYVAQEEKNRNTQNDVGSIELTPSEKGDAATDAIHARRNHMARYQQQRYPLTPLQQQTDVATNVSDSLLSRARERKVRKQVDPKWLHARNDITNRPRAPLERDEELSLREPLFRTQLADVVVQGVFYDQEDAAKCAERMRTPSSSVWTRSGFAIDTRGTIGLPGCCFDTWYQ